MSAMSCRRSVPSGIEPSGASSRAWSYATLTAAGPADDVGDRERDRRPRGDGPGAAGGHDQVRGGLGRVVRASLP